MSWNVPFVIVAVKEKSEAHYQVETGLQYGTVQPIWPDHNNNIIIIFNKNGLQKSVTDAVVSYWYSFSIIITTRVRRPLFNAYCFFRTIMLYKYVFFCWLS